MLRKSESPMTSVDRFRRRLPLRAVTATVLAGAAGVSALVVVGLSGAGSHALSFAGAALTALTTLVLVFWLLRGLEREEAAEMAGGPAPPTAPEPPYALALEGLPDPVMLVGAGEADEAGGPRLLFSNAAAREMFRLQRRGGLLAAAIRNPLVLEAIEEALYGRIESEAVFEGG